MPDRETAERAADSALFGATLLMQGQLLRAAYELAERHPVLRESPQGFQVSLEEFMADFAREVGGVGEGAAARWLMSSECKECSP